MNCRLSSTRSSTYRVSAFYIFANAAMLLQRKAKLTLPSCSFGISIIAQQVVAEGHVHIEVKINRKPIVQYSYF